MGKCKFVAGRIVAEAEIPEPERKRKQADIKIF
jgi:hypothetical protein